MFQLGRFSVAPVSCQKEDCRTEVDRLASRTRYPSNTMATPKAIAIASVLLFAICQGYGTKVPDRLAPVAIAVEQMERQ